MQKNKRFNKKKAVRFQLVPGRDQHGNPTTMFKPIQTKKSKLSLKQQQKIINQISDYQIQIDGKPVNQSDIPEFILEQIKGRADLVFIQKNPDLVQFKEEEDIEGEDQNMMQEYEQQNWEQGEIIPEQQYMNAETLQEKQLQQKQDEQQQLKQYQVDGKKYMLTKTQIKQLEEVLPQNYQNYKIQGVQFVKYDQFGNRIDQKQQYQRYIAEPQQRRAIIDSFDYVPPKPINTVDNDLEGEVLKGDLKQIQDALNYDGQEQAYQQMEDDFFAKMLQNDNNKKQEKKKAEGQGFKKKKQQIASTSTSQPTKLPKLSNTVQSTNNKKTSQINKNSAIQNQNKAAEKIAQKQKKQPQTKQKKVSKLDDIQYGEDDQNDEDYQDIDDDQDYSDYQDQQITDQMLDQAIKQFDNKKDTNAKKPIAQQQQEEQIQERIAGTGIPLGMKGMELVKFIQSRQQCIGKDGQLDWRTLTKKQKRQYMKNKKIRQIYEQIRERQIQQKLRGKTDVKAQQLHLKQYIQNIPYQQDHVMHEAIVRDQQQIVSIQNAINNQQDYQTQSDQDDIISYRAKTSIISSNLATVQENTDGKKKRKNKQDCKQKEQKEQGKEQKIIKKVKVVPEQRNRNQTSQQRKERKQKLKQLKKQKKEQKKQFSQMFEGERKKFMKQDKNINNNNPLHKVSYVKIV